MDWVGLASAVASAYGKQQQGKATGAVQQAGVTQNQDQNALARYIAMQNAQNSAANTDLQRQQFTQNSRGTNAKQAIIGALMGGFSPTGSVSSGVTKAMTSPEARAAMMELNRQGLTAQFTPPSFTGGNTLTPPPQTKLPDVGGNSFLTTLASLAQLAGAASPYLTGNGYDTPPQDGQ